jgi:hypothetical protein
MSQLSFLALSLALPAILLAAHLAKRLLATITDINVKKEILKREHSTFTESTVLQAIYWLCLVTGLMIAILIFILLLSEFSQFLWITQPAHVVEVLHYHPGVFLVLLSFLALAIILLFRQWSSVLEYTEILVWSIWYPLVELPVNLLLNPAYKGLIFLTTSYCKAGLYLAFYTALYVTLAILYSQFIWRKSADLNPPPVGLMYLLFYVVALLANAIGTAFNWLLLNIVGVLFIVQEKEVDASNEEELPLKSVRRLYYTIKYIQ